MIPILYESTEKDFTTNGLGRLKDAISCSVKEERNGTYELSMVYPISGIHYDLIENDRIIYAMPADGKGPQPFRIYKISKPLSGQVTISAEHISYLLASAVIMPFTASSCADAINKINNNIIGASGFSFSTDKAVSGTYTLDKPTEVRTVLGGSSGSLLDTYGKGEYEFDHFDVILRLNRGVDNGVTIRYGKNLTDLTAEYDMTNVYTGIVPYAASQDSAGNEITVTLPEKVIKSSHTGDYAYPLYKVVDFSQDSDRESTLTEAELRTLAQAYVTNNEGWEVATNLTVSFVALWQTDEYKNLAALERVNLCDTVHVVYTDLGVNTTAKVIATDFDVLNERYNSIELGENTTNLSKTISDAINSSTDSLKDEVSALPAAITKATKKITGGLGGYIVIKQNANGQPEELLIMDTDDVNTAVNVWRWNKGGLGHSHNGYDGPFDDVAITQDGAIVADYITTGTLNADLIKAGVIQDEAGSFYLDMKNGTLRLANGTFQSTGDDRIVLIEEGQYKVKHADNGVAHNVGSIGALFNNSDRTEGMGMWARDEVARLAFGVYDSAEDTIFYKLTYNIADGYWETRGQCFNYINLGYSATHLAEIYAVEEEYSRSGLTMSGARILTLKAGTKDNYGGIRLIIDGYVAAEITRRTTEPNYDGFYRWHLWNTRIEGVYELYANIIHYSSLIQDSDRRLKDNIKDLDIEESARFVYGLKPTSYVMKDHPNEVRHGFIAQDVQEIIDGDWSPVGTCPDKDENGDPYLSLGYIELIADMVATIQSQHKRITDLEERLAKIEEALNADN